jgi:hypothetical protein
MLHMGAGNYSAYFNSGNMAETDRDLREAISKPRLPDEEAGAML